MIFKNVSIAGLAHVDAPHTLTSDEINERLKPTMQRLGIKCAVHETREADGSAGCSDTHTAAGCSGNCSACDIEEAGHGK